MTSVAASGRTTFWTIAVTFFLGIAFTLFVAHPYLCDKRVSDKGTVCHPVKWGG
jgi:hypothetical protein